MWTVPRDVYRGPGRSPIAAVGGRAFPPGPQEEFSTNGHCGRAGRRVHSGQRRPQSRPSPIGAPMLKRRPSPIRLGRPWRWPSRATPGPSPGQGGGTPGADDERAHLGQALNFTEQLLARKIDEQMLFQALAEIAQVEKVRYTGPPPRVAKNPTAPGAKNPVVIPAYTFLPKKYLAGHEAAADRVRPRRRSRQRRGQLRQHPPRAARSRGTRSSPRTTAAAPATAGSSGS